MAILVPPVRFVQTAVRCQFRSTNRSYAPLYHFVHTLDRPATHEITALEGVTCSAGNGNTNVTQFLDRILSNVRNEKRKFSVDMN